MSTRVRKDGSFNRLSAQSVTQSNPAAIALSGTIPSGASASGSISPSGSRIPPGIYAVKLTVATNSGALTGGSVYVAPNYVVGVFVDSTGVTSMAPATVACEAYTSMIGSTALTLDVDNSASRFRVTITGTSTDTLYVTGTAQKLA